MRRVTWRVLPASLMLIVASIIPAPNSHAAAPKPNAVNQALAFMPATTTIAAFTDWTLIKAYKGATTLTSASPWSAQVAFLSSLSKDQAPAAAFALDYSLEMGQLWSFDSLDLQWEASGEGPGPQVSVLRFKDSFNLAPVVAHFTQRNYSRTTYRAVTLYSHALDLTMTGYGGPLILFAAYLPDPHVLIISAAQAPVKATLDAYLGAAPSLAGEAPMQATVGALGVVAAAIFEPGGTCAAFGVSDVGIQTEPKNLPTLRKQIHKYDTFGIGYREVGGRPVGVADLHFATHGDAAADLQVRRMLAATGINQYAGRPYSETLFTLINASVVGSNLGFQLRPFHDLTRALFIMVDSANVLFALCP